MNRYVGTTEAAEALITVARAVIDWQANSEGSPADRAQVSNAEINSDEFANYLISKYGFKDDIGIEIMREITRVAWEFAPGNKFTVADLPEISRKARSAAKSGKGNQISDSEAAHGTRSVRAMHALIEHVKGDDVFARAFNKL